MAEFGRLLGCLVAGISKISINFLKTRRIRLEVLESQVIKPNYKILSNKILIFSTISQSIKYFWRIRGMRLVNGTRNFVCSYDLWNTSK